jgi:hypothetical protein
MQEVQSINWGFWIGEFVLGMIGFGFGFSFWDRDSMGIEEGCWGIEDSNSTILNVSTSYPLH